jgi:hypothetical protein
MAAKRGRQPRAKRSSPTLREEAALRKRREVLEVLSRVLRRA